MRYSIIIPVYNGEKTLGRCLDSLLGQDFTDYEIVLINDGSRDGSDAVCQVYAGKYPQIHYICQENGGVSAARNRALDSARGEYVLFVDCDDLVAANYFAVIDSVVTRSQPDMLLFGAESVDGQSGRWNTGTFSENTEEGVAGRIAWAMERYLFSALWNKCFKRELIERTAQRFSGDLDIGEDQAFIFDYVMKVTSIVSIEDVLYKVDVSDMDSLSRKVRPYLLTQMLCCMKEMYAVYQRTPHSPEAGKVYERALSWVFYRSAYSCVKEQQKLESDSTRRRENIRSICSAYSQKKIRPRGWKCGLIALPVRWHLAGVLDRLAGHR